jgi:hypothetical protein
MKRAHYFCGKEADSRCQMAHILANQGPKQNNALHCFLFQAKIIARPQNNVPKSSPFKINSLEKASNFSSDQFSKFFFTNMRNFEGGFAGGIPTKKRN